MTEKMKRPVARRTLYLAIEEALERYDLARNLDISDLLEAIKDEWFRENK